MAQTFERFREICQQAGLKVTPQRFEIFRELSTAQDHPSAERLHERLTARMPSLSLDTVYRTLATLESHGVVRQVEAYDGRAHFDGNPEIHHHLICRECSRIVDFAWPRADRLHLPPEAEGWGRIDHRPVELRGVCGECLRRREADDDA